MRLLRLGIPTDTLKAFVGCWIQIPVMWCIHGSLLKSIPGQERSWLRHLAFLLYGTRSSSNFHWLQLFKVSKKVNDIDNQNTLKKRVTWSTTRDNIHLLLVWWGGKRNTRPLYSSWNWYFFLYRPKTSFFFVCVFWCGLGWVAAEFDGLWDGRGAQTSLHRGGTEAWVLEMLLCKL